MFLSCAELSGRGAAGGGLGDGCWASAGGSSSTGVLRSEVLTSGELRMSNEEGGGVNNRGNSGAAGYTAVSAGGMDSGRDTTTRGGGDGLARSIGELDLLPHSESKMSCWERSNPTGLDCLLTEGIGEAGSRERRSGPNKKDETRESGRSTISVTEGSLLELLLEGEMGGGGNSRLRTFMACPNEPESFCDAVGLELEAGGGISSISE